MTQRRRTIHTFYALAATSLCVLSIGCSDKNENAPATNNAPNSVDPKKTGGTPFVHADWQPSADPTRIISHGLQFTKPATWIETPPITSLRETNYTIPGVPKSMDGPGGDSAELVLFYMNADEAMTAEAHVDRWLQQFAPDDSGQRPTPRIDTIPVGDAAVPIYELRGSYVRSGSAWFTPGQAMIAAVLDVPTSIADGGQLIFRIAGPEATVDANRDIFITLIASAMPADVTPPTETVP